MQPHHTCHVLAVGFSPVCSSKSVNGLTAVVGVLRCSQRASRQRCKYDVFGAALQVNAYLFDGYWEDIGTIKSFFDENLKLAAQ